MLQAIGRTLNRVGVARDDEMLVRKAGLMITVPLGLLAGAAHALSKGNPSLQRLGREVLVSFQNHACITLCHNFATADGLSHFALHPSAELCREDGIDVAA